MPNAHIWYEVCVTASDGREIDNSMCGSLEIAQRAVARFRALYPDVLWITVNRKNKGRITALISMTVHNGTTAAERRALAAMPERKRTPLECSAGQTPKQGGVS